VRSARPVPLRFSARITWQPVVRSEAQREAILRHVGMVERAGRKHLDEPHDEADLSEQIDLARQDLDRY